MHKGKLATGIQLNDEYGSKH